MNTIGLLYLSDSKLEHGVCNEDTGMHSRLLNVGHVLTSAMTTHGELMIFFKISGSWCNNEDIMMHYILPKVNYNMDVGVNDIKVDSCRL